MRIHALTLSLAELQQALRDYAEKHASSQPDVVYVESFGKVKIVVDLRPGAVIEAAEFRHRAQA